MTSIVGLVMWRVSDSLKSLSAGVSLDGPGEAGGWVSINGDLDWLTLENLVNSVLSLIIVVEVDFKGWGEHEVLEDHHWDYNWLETGKIDKH